MITGFAMYYDFFSYYAEFEGSFKLSIIDNILYLLYACFLPELLYFMWSNWVIESYYFSTILYDHTIEIVLIYWG
jgi:hypothetical protein